MTSSSSRKKTICFFGVAAHLGGAERSVLELLRQIRLNEEVCGYGARVLMPKNEGAFIDEVRKLGITVDVIEMPAKFLALSRSQPGRAVVDAMVSSPAVALYLAKLAKYFKATSPDLIYTTGIKCHLVSALLKPVLQMPVLWHLRDILAPGPTLVALRAAAALGHIALAANSKATAEAFSNAPFNIDVVYNGFDAKALQPRRNRMFNELFKVDASIPIVGMLGVVARWKGQLEFLRMARQVLDQGIDARFVVIGSEIYDTSGDRGFFDTVKEEAKKLGLHDHVHFAGYMNNPAEALNGLDALVHASTKPEPFGRVIVEAMACRVPVVASRAGGVLEIIEERQTGLLFEPANPTDMARALSTLLNDSALREAIALRARKSFEERFTNEQYFAAMNKLFQRFLVQP